MSQNLRKLGVIATITCLVLIVIIFEYAIDNTWNTILQFSIIGSALLFTILFFIFFVRTGIWKFVHIPFAKLDERERIISSKTLRIAYSIFSVTVLAILLSFTLLDRKTSIVLDVSLILFAHIIPVSIIAWSQKQIKEEE